VSGEASIGDLLTAASILAALLTFLYANAYATISEAVDIERGERRRADLRRERRQVHRALWPAAAVLLASLALAVVFAREVFDLVRDGDVFSKWDAIGLSLVVVWLAFLAVAAHAAGSTLQLATKYRELNRAP
jgi:4-hydroxybenzoate polyprenyltransferase